MKIEVPEGLQGRLLARAREFRKEPTPSERMLWQAIRNRRLGAKFRRQQPFGPFVVDFFCPERSLVVEVDGPIHLDQIDADGARQELLESCGYRVLRVRADAVETDLATVLDILAAALSAAEALDESGLHIREPCSPAAPFPPLHEDGAAP